VKTRTADCGFGNLTRQCPRTIFNLSRHKTRNLQSIPPQNAQSTTYPATKRRFRLSRHNDYYIKGGIPYCGTRIPLMPLYDMPDYAHSSCGGTGGIFRPELLRSGRECSFRHKVGTAQKAGDAENAQSSTYPAQKRRETPKTRNLQSTI